MSVSTAAQTFGANVLEEVIVTGTRMVGRSPGDSPAPVDVISAAEFSNQAGGDMSDLIRNLVPSYNVNATGDASSLVRPASLRGLSSGATLVLVNGKRRHRAAVISFLGAGVSDGAQGPDISVIPSAALKQLEVLRDGAAAQYGSDAIAGVMNFLLKDDSSGGFLEFKSGESYEGDGESQQLAANIGLPFLTDGFVNISFEYREADGTSRSVQRSDAAGLIAAGNSAVKDPAQSWGSAEVFHDFKSFVNMGKDIGSDREWYAFANYAERRVETGFSFRNPNTRGGVFGSSLNLAGALADAHGNAIPFLIDENNNTVSRDQIVGSNGLIRADLGDQPWVRRYDRTVADLSPSGESGNCPQTDANNNGGLDIRDTAGLAAVAADPNCFVFNELFPGGFTPRFGADLEDLSVVSGVRGVLKGGMVWDVSGGVGRNEAEFYIKNTINASIGPASPTKFTPGAYVQEEKNINVDLSYSIDGDITQSIAGGFEWRKEQFEVLSGDAASWEVGSFVDQGFSIGSNGFSGFSPDVVGEWSRSNIAFYTDYEAQLNKNLLLGAALRWENYDSFGSTTNFKLSAYWSVTDYFAVRATHSTGFSAPTPGQANISNITTALVDGVLINRGTIPPTNGISKLYGGEELTPEKSKNYSLGALIDFGDFNLSVDAYRVEMKDRITQSADISLQEQEAQELEDAGFSGASGLRSFRFYVNDFDTETEGIDVVANYPFEMNGGNSTLSMAYNYNTTEVTRFNAVTLDELRIFQIENSFPRHRGNLTWNHVQGSWRTMLRANYFGSYWIAHASNLDLVFEPAAEMTVDIELAASFGRGKNYTIIAGAENVFDNSPDRNPYSTVIGAKYSEYTPSNGIGGVYYVRLRYEF